MSKPRIALPLPTSSDFEYNQRSWPQYAHALEFAGGEPVHIPLIASPAEIASLASSCQAILLPGSPADVNPRKYGHPLDPATAPADLPRENVDELLLQDAHNLHKPILGICYGLQSLNVWRGGTLIQDLPTPLPVNHRAGKSVGIAHAVKISDNSLLRDMVASDEAEIHNLPVNSSHHQAVDIPGDNLQIIARSSQDDVVEAVQGLAADHFVLGIQWHPERSYEISATSRALFQRFVEEASRWTPREVRVSVV